MIQDVKALSNQIQNLAEKTEQKAINLCIQTTSDLNQGREGKPPTGLKNTILQQKLQILFDSIDQESKLIQYVNSILTDKQSNVYEKVITTSDPNFGNEYEEYQSIESILNKREAYLEDQSKCNYFL